MDWHSKITHTNNVLARSQNSRYPKFAKNSPKKAILGYFESLREKIAIDSYEPIGTVKLHTPTMF